MGDLKANNMLFFLLVWMLFQNTVLWVIFIHSEKGNCITVGTPFVLSTMVVILLYLLLEVLLPVATVLWQDAISLGTPFVFKRTESSIMGVCVLFSKQIKKGEEQ